MKSSLLLLAGAAALSLASCSQTTTETTTTKPADASAGTTTTTTTTDVTYKSRGSRMADKFAADMKITDEATREKLRTAYFNRSKRYGEMRAKYTSDTTGMGAAVRQYRTDTDTEFKGILTNADQYKSYESSRSTYDEANNLSDEASGSMSGTSTSMGSGAASTDNSAAGSGTKSGGETSAAGAATGATVESGKTKMADGSKIKVKEDGTVKIKDADGNKTKMKM